MLHFKNIIADTNKLTDKEYLESKYRQHQKAEIVVHCASFFDLLERAKILSLKTQKEDTDLIKAVD